MSLFIFSFVSFLILVSLIIAFIFLEKKRGTEEEERLSALRKSVVDKMKLYLTEEKQIVKRIDELLLKEKSISQKIDNSISKEKQFQDHLTELQNETKEIEKRIENLLSQEQKIIEHYTKVQENAKLQRHLEESNIKNKDLNEKKLTVQKILDACVLVKAGSFIMSRKDGENWENEIEHKVILTENYYISKFEVTQGIFQHIMGNNPSSFRGVKRPVDNVTWYDAVNFCKELNKYEIVPKGWIFSLPTEAQWEFAAKSGKDSCCMKYCGSNTVSDVAWFFENSCRKTYNVGELAPNELGLYDMSGNVWEWCLDWYEKESCGEKTDPHGPLCGEYRVLRGGSCTNIARHCRITCRELYDPNSKLNNVGFRVVLVQEHSEEEKENLKKISDQVKIRQLRKQAFTAGLKLSDDGLTIVGVQNCVALSSCKIPAGVIRIGENAFIGCENLVDVFIPESLKEIGAHAFHGCHKLKNITLPSSIENIGNAAFYEVTSVLVSPENQCFYTDLQGVLFDKKRQSILFAPQNISGDYNIPLGTKSIEERAFWKCCNLVKITIPKSVRHIGDWAFYGCFCLVNVILPSHNITMGVGVFYGCYRILKNKNMRPYVEMGGVFEVESESQENDGTLK